MLEKLKAALKAVAEEMAKEKADRDEARVAEALRAADEAMKGLKAAGADGPGEREATQKMLAQLRVDCDALAEGQRDTARRITVPRFVPGRTISGGRPMMRFSHPDLAREFGEMCLRIHSGDIKALTPAEGPEGGYMVGETFSDEIDQMIQSVGVAREIAGAVPLGPGVNHFPRSLAGAVAYFKAAGAAATESTPTLGMLNMSPETLIAVITHDIELEQDSLVLLGNYLGSELAWALADKEDSVAFAGTGSPAEGLITGILASDRVAVHTMPATDTTFAKVAFDDLDQLEACVWERGLGEALFVMSRSIKATIKSITDAGGAPVWQPAAAGEPATLRGYPVKTTQYMPALSATAVSTKFLAFGNFRRALKFGRRGQVVVDFSDAPHWTNLQKTWRAYERIMIAVNGFTAAEIAASTRLINAVAVLKTAAA